ncbi:hypothetical protein T07_5247 [Trichinella nelsoni]|uniref:Uncharacterized protein n=1 Tax=Trichinella nelsoni TaxID=6336 RepID=A0A0V0S8A5_9BILA|nr:hypothetical protein T07_5247 [Trichinella nelsoni]
MHKYAVIAFPFIFSNLRCFREKYLHNNAILRSTSDAEEEGILKLTLCHIHINECYSSNSATLLSF